VIRIAVAAALEAIAAMLLLGSVAMIGRPPSRASG
jgi:hypothetical protein